LLVACSFASAAEQPPIAVLGGRASDRNLHEHKTTIKDCRTKKFEAS
jgi:hypothetical protein